MKQPSPAAHSRLSPFAFLATMLFAVVPALAQDGIQSLALPIADLVLPHAPTPRLPFYTMLGLRNYWYWPTLVPDRTEPEALLEFDSLIHFIGMADASLEEESSATRTESHRLLLRGTAEHLQSFRDLTELLRSEVAATIHIEAAIIRHDGTLLPPAIAATEQADALLSGQTAAWHDRSSTPAHMATYLGDHRAASYLHSYMPEVAEESWQPGPRYDELFDGIGMVAVAHRLAASDDLILQVQFAASQLVTLAPFEGTTKDLPGLQQPVVDATVGSMSGRIQNGGALVFNATAPKEFGGNITVIVRASWTPPTRKAPDHVLILPVSSLVARCCAAPQFAQQERVALAMRSDDSLQQIEEREPLIDESRLMDLITTEIEPDAWDDTARMAFLSGCIVCTGEAALLKKVKAFVVAQQQQLLHTVEVTLHSGSGRITMPALTDHGHGVRHGRETTGIAQLDIEIAKKASIVIPRIVRMFDGIEFGMQTYADNQEIGAQLNWTMRRMDSQPTAKALPPVRILARSHTGAVPEAGLAAGDGPFGKASWQLRLR